MNDLEFKAYHYARLKIELALVMGWIDIIKTPQSVFDEMEEKFQKEYLEKYSK